MEKGIEELLKPRYKVLAEWPGAEFLVGDVFTFQLTTDFEAIDVNGEVWYDSNNAVFLDTCKKYPHLFKRLEWWEDRKPEEINWIEYLIWNQKTGKSYPFKMMKLNHERRVAEWNSRGYGPPLIECEPTTEAVYQQYQKEFEESLK